MQLWLKPSLAQQIIDHAHREQPCECCGVILGEGSLAQEVVPVPNIADDPKTQFQMDTKALTEALYRTQNEALQLIGLYHSHPRTDPIPSQTDIRFAAYPDAAYVIASLKNGECQLAAWSIQRDRVVPIELTVSDSSPTQISMPLSKIQKRAIVAAAIIAFMFMLVLSLSLLPPAPIIPTH